MLESHKFYMDYMSRLDIKKNENLEKLRRKIPGPSFVPNAVTSMPEGKNDMAEKKIKAHKENMADRTIETMFRTTASSGQRLSSKATMLRNLYDQGLVLSKKYRMLKISYSVFMYGLVISVLAFFIASKYLG